MDETHYSTPDPKLRAVLEDIRLRHRKVRVWYGDPDKGTVWHETFDVVGRIGRSMGPVKVPLLIRTARSTGGHSLMDNRIVRIVETATKRVLYEHPSFKMPEYLVRPAPLESETEWEVGVMVGNVFLPLRVTKSETAAQRARAFLSGERMAP